ncbi:MAG TPA: zinc-binding alcohol dehydrogenase family protein [Streptosporangiaceae bacterium]|nr:zinc-binding alcohol dehydrogenase family protein [Streptosporangiaceae bacterium]
MSRRPTALAVRVPSASELGSLRLENVPRPVSGPGEVLVAVQAAAVNRSDVLSVRGLMPMTTFPRVPGRDFAGVVVEGPADLHGRRVWGCGGSDFGFTQDGSHAELLVVPLEAAVPMPETMSFDDAAASALAYFTAYEALTRAGEVNSGSTVLVTGAAGAVGTAASSLAARRGARVIGAVRGSEVRTLGQASGLHVVIDTETDDVATAIREATDGRGVDLAVDTVGGTLLASVLGCLAQGAGVCVISSSPATPIGFDVLDFYRAELHLTGLNTGRLDCRRAAEVLRSLQPGFDDGTLRAPRIASRHPLAGAAAAYEKVQDGAGGRVLILPTA